MKKVIILLYFVTEMINLINAQECSEKKGIGTWTNPKAGNHWMDSLNLSWYYNWDFKPSSDYTGNLEFIPMIWGDYDYYINDATLQFIEARNFSALLGFNEPDHKDQANMSVSRAIELWPELESTGKRLGSPAMAGTAYQENGWLDQFIKIAEAKGYRVDFICIHIYQQNFDVNHVLDYCRKTYEKYHRPIWITEWSLANWDGTTIEDQASMEEQARYLFEVIKALDFIEYVERHAWFAMWDGHWAGMPWPMYMVDENTQKLTVIGEAIRYVCERDSFYMIPDIIPPGIPQGLSAQYEGDSIILDWTNNNEADFAFYNIYRSETSGLDYNMIKSGILTSDYVDLNSIKGITYYYIITAVDTAGNESGFSTEVSSNTTLVNPGLSTGGKGISIYPNPFYQSFEVITPDDQFNIIEIISLDGTRVFKKEINLSSDSDINLEKIEPGIYILKILSDINVQSLKIIKL